MSKIFYEMKKNPFIQFEKSVNTLNLKFCL